MKNSCLRKACFSPFLGDAAKIHCFVLQIGVLDRVNISSPFVFLNTNSMLIEVQSKLRRRVNLRCEMCLISG